MSARGTTGFNDDLIHDFSSSDKIDVSAWGITDFGQIQALLYRDSHHDAAFDAYYAGHDHVLRIANVDLNDLTASDFIFSTASVGHTVTGTSHDDVLFGTTGNDVINGGNGDDTLLGGAGNDVLSGGFGLDNFDGGSGFDTVSYAYDTDESVHVNLACGVAEFSDGAREYLNSIEAVTGSGVSDVLIGSNVNNTLQGGAGNDVLEGDKGADKLVGGTGHDSFVYAALSDSTVAATGRDTITDFASGDRIDLVHLENALHEDVTFVGAAAFSHHAGELHFVVSGGNTIVSLDSNGDGTADFAILLTGSHTLTAGDFIL